MAIRLNYDHYKVLGVEPWATSDVVKQAYRTRVKQCHPDVDPSPKAHHRFLVVQEAYMVLSDPQKRKNFDERLLHCRSANEERNIRVPKFENTDHKRSTHVEVPLPTFAFIGLHLTGLLFGMAIVLGISFSIVFLDWAYYMLFFTIPGLLVIPDSLNGLRIAMRSSADQS